MSEAPVTSSPQAPSAAPTSSAAPAASSTPAQPSSASPEKPATDTRSAAERARDQTGRFTKRAPGPTKQRLMRESLAMPEAVAPAASEQPANIAEAEKPAETAQVAEKPKEEPKAPEVTADPKTWPEPARLAHEQVAAQVAAYEGEITKWREAGPKAVEQNRRLAEENKLLRQLVQQAGVNVDPRDLDLIRYRVAEQAREQQGQWSQQRAEAEKAARLEQQKEAGRREAQQIAQKISEAAKAANVDPREVGALYLGNQQLGRTVDIPALIEQVKARQLMEHRAAAANTPAPVRSQLPASNLIPHDRSRAGKEARLKNWGVT